MATNLAAHVTKADLKQMQDNALWTHFASYQQKENFGAENDFYSQGATTVVTAPREEDEEEDD
ncbi:MAG: hypothetical protein H6765_01645 [Candidatus Peribacteria bacterium]|nr:MAG: hypothetical protein H6765_01645 [Candidatus Peribacteria bacterium]